MTILLVALGAALGAPLRYAAGKLLDGVIHSGTLLVNTVASLLLGAAVGWSLDGAALAFVATGFSGGMSTYSSFAVQTRDLPRGRAATYAVLTVVLGLLACAGGYALTA